MKGSLAAMIAAGAYLKADHYNDLAGEILVAASVREECFEGIASRKIGERYRPDYMVISEASSLDVKRGQRGRAEIVLETLGKPAHSSNPEDGINAVRKMVKLLQAIETTYVPPQQGVLGRGILELTDIISSPYPGASVVPDRCRVTFDRRLLIGETEEKVLETLQDIIDKLASQDRYFRATVSKNKCYTGIRNPMRAKRFAPAWLLPEGHELVVKATKGLKASSWMRARDITP